MTMATNISRHYYYYPITQLLGVVKEIRSKLQVM